MTISPDQSTWPLSCSRRTALRGAAFAAATVSLAACAPSQPTKSESAPGPVASPTKSEQPLPDSQWTSVKPTLVDGLSEVSLSKEATGITVTTPRFSTARNLTQATEVVRNRILREAHWADSQKVGISASLLAASTDAVGLAVVAAVDADQPTVPCVIWYDARKQQSFASPELISPQSWGEFAAAVQTAAKDAGVDTEKVDSALIDRSAPYGNGPAMAFNAKGELVLSFRKGAVGEELQQLIVDASTWLSDFGLLAQTASTSPSQFTGKASISIKNFTPGEDRSPVTASPNRPTDGSDTEDTLLTPTPGGAIRPSTAIGYDGIAERCVALTYDDGPGAKTPDLLSVLKDAKAAVTFFEMGDSIKAYPDTPLQVAIAGHEIGSHTVTHPDLAHKSAERIEREVSENSALLKEATGFEPLLFRPPYGSHNKTVDDIVAKHGMAIVQWSVDTEDWKTKSTPETIAVAVKDGKAFTEPIILMHDIHSSTVAAAAEIVQQLSEADIHLVTVSELSLNTGGVFTGHAYCRGTGIKQEGFACEG